MALKLRVPTLKDQQSAQELKELIHTSESGADVEIDVQSKTVTIESKASEETFRELIVSAGHSIE
ncbi:MAG: hypothetical protein Kow00121_07250 [Elainellaceae cyanobacterium]